MNDRRDFLKKSAVGVSGWALSGSIPGLRAQTSPAAPSERCTLGFVGVGGMGQYHLAWFKDQPDVEVVGLCDVDARHLDAAANLLADDSVKRYRDYRDLMANESIDAVLVATPDHWHGLVAVAAAEQGKHIYCEKPLTNTIGEGRALVSAVQQANVVLQTGSHERSNPGARIAKQLIADGRLGEVHTVRIQLPTGEPHLQRVKSFKGTPQTEPVPEEFDYDFWLGHTPAVPYCKERCHFYWRFISSYGGGEITDRGCHVIDLVHFILSKDDTGPVEIAATGKLPEPGLYDAFLDFEFRNRYADGLVMIGNNEAPRGAWFEGSEGRLFVEVHDGALSAEPASILSGLEIPPAQPYVAHRRNFLEAVKTRGRCVAPVQAGHRTATVCHLNNLAMRLGRGFQWDPRNERADDEDVNRLLKPSMREPWSLG